MSLVTERWNRDIGVLDALRTSWNDQLSIVNGHLHLEKGTEDSEWGFTSTPVTKDPSAIADHLESLIKSTAKELLSTLLTSKSDTPAFYEQVSLLHRQSKCLYKRVSSLQYTFRSSIFDSNYAQRYSDLFKLAYGFSDEVKKFKSTLAKPPLSERAAQHLDYNERTEASKYYYPKRVPLKETVAAAKKALSLAEQKKPKSLLMRTFLIIGSITLLVPSMFLTGLKILFWNPFELLIRGRVTTRSPYNLTLKWLGEGLFESKNAHLSAYQDFCTQLLHCPEITDEVARAFDLLAPRAEVLDLGQAELFSFARDLDELKLFIEEDNRPGAISVATFIGLIKNRCGEEPERRFSLRGLKTFYSLYNRVYLEKGHEVNLNEFFENALDIGVPYKHHKVFPQISHKILLQLLNSAAFSKTCNKIVLSKSIAQLPVVQNFLNQHSYQQMMLEDSNEESINLVYRLKTSISLVYRRKA
jgi:hypothetical protein